MCGVPTDTHIVSQTCNAEGSAWLPTQETWGTPGVGSGGTIGTGGWVSMGAGGIDPTCCPRGCNEPCTPGAYRYCGGNGTDSYDVHQYCRCDGLGWGPFEIGHNSNETGGAGCGVGGSSGGFRDAMAEGAAGAEAGAPRDAGTQPQDARVRADASTDGSL